MVENLRSCVFQINYKLFLLKVEFIINSENGLCPLVLMMAELMPASYNVSAWNRYSINTMFL